MEQYCIVRFIVFSVHSSVFGQRSLGTIVNEAWLSFQISLSVSDAAQYLSVRFARRTRIAGLTSKGARYSTLTLHLLCRPVVLVYWFVALGVCAL